MSPVDIYLIRGLARETAHWGDFFALLESQDFVNSITGLDLLGAGQFYKVAAPLSIQQNAEFLISQIPTGSDVPKVIVSVSLGSMVAIEMAQLRPDLFHKVFVMNTSFSNLSPLYHRLQINAFKQFFMIAKSKTLVEQEKEVLIMVSRERQKHDAIAKEWAEISKLRPMPKANFVRQLTAAARYKLADDPPDVPIVIFNSKGDQMVHPSCSEKLSSYWNLPLETHPTAGHDICTDDPEWVIEHLAKGLSS